MGQDRVQVLERRADVARDRIAELEDEVETLKAEMRAFAAMLTPLAADPKLQLVVGEVAKELGMPVPAILGPGRTRDVVMPRQMAFYVAGQVVGLSLTQIGLGMNRDHTSVLHGIRAHTERMQANAQLRARTATVASRVAALTNAPQEALSHV